MASSRSSRLRKQKRKKSDAQPCISLILIPVALFCVYLFSSLIEPTERYNPASAATETDTLLQCEESCKENKFLVPAGLSNENDVLAFSAVDALFNFRGEDSIIEGKSPTVTKRRGEQNQSSQHVPTSKKNSSTRPLRLHPLIQALAGTVDESELSRSSSSTTKATTRINSGEDKKEACSTTNNDLIPSSTDTRDGELSSWDIGDIQASDDSVALVAVAAAAALWSESEPKRDRFRMKTFNTDWEESLRWIASWAFDGLEKDSISMRSSESCIKRCLEGDGADSLDESRERGNYLQKQQQQHKNLGGQTSAALRWISNMFTSIILIPSHIHMNLPAQAHIQYMKSIFGMILSTAIILGTRNAMGWLRHKHSLRLLLAEEPNEANPIRIHNRTKTSGKKSGSKKAKRKRRATRRTRENHVQNYNREPNELCSDRDDHSVSSDSSVDSHILYPETIRRTVSHCFAFSSEGQGNKDHTTNVAVSSCMPEDVGSVCRTSTSSHMTDSAESDYHTSQEQGVLANSEPFLIEQKSNSRSQRDQVQHSPPICKGASRRSLAKQERRSVSSNRYKRVGPSQIHSPSFKNEKDGTATYISPEELKAKREEASRQLRDFQAAQIQKYIKSKEAQKSRELSQTIPLHSLVNTNSFRIPHNTTTVSERNFSAPIERKSEEILDQNNDQNNSDGFDVVEPNIDARDYVERNILNILDEGEEQNLSHTQIDQTSISPELDPGRDKSPVQNNFIQQQGQIQSIALGDLLAGSFPLTPQRNSPTSIQHNPWSGDINNSTVDEDSSFVESPLQHGGSSSVWKDSDCTDANVCLQVSAREFSPSI